MEIEYKQNNDTVLEILSPFLVLILVVTVFSIKPMYLYATDKQAYYQNELDSIEQVGKDKNEQFKSGKLGLAPYLSSMKMIVERETEYKLQINKYNNTKGN